MRTRVYVAGPITVGDQKANVTEAIKVGQRLLDEGYAPLVPHLSYLWDKELPGNTWETWLALDLPWVVMADAVVRIPGESKGADQEVQTAAEWGIPVYHDVDALLAHPPAIGGDPRFHKVLRSLAQLHDKKQADYGAGNDPLANIRGAEEWGLPGWVGGMIRLQDKVRRLQSFARKGRLENESAEDSFLDIAVYAVLNLLLYREASEQQHKGQP